MVRATLALHRVWVLERPHQAAPRTVGLMADTGWGGDLRKF